MTDSLATLNDRQREAAMASEGRVRVVAGAGSGKTRVLAHRFAFLVNEIGISPANILCMTFTNKAAQEMKSRIAKLVDRGDVNDFICTIHGFCVKVLRRDIYRMGYPKSFSIIDESDAKMLAKQAMEEYGIDRRKMTAERFLTSVAELKGYDPYAYISRWLMPAAGGEVDTAQARYIKLQLKHYCLDYDDLIYFTMYILEHFADAREYWTDKLNYIMVDEVQDCTGDDWKLLHILMSRHGNLFIVGDPDQAIYEWRGANPKAFVRFNADTDVVLERNYRSTPDILNVANAIIVNNENRVPKELYTVRLNERLPLYHHFKTEQEEADFVAQTIAEGIAKGERGSDFAVLYRAAHLSRRIEQALLRDKIPYTVWGGVRFYERMEIKDALAYLNLIAGQQEDLALQRIINIPSRRFGKAAVARLKELAAQQNVSLLKALETNISDKAFRRTQAAEFLSLIERGRQLSSMMPVSELSDYVFTNSGLTDYYRNDTDEERLENLSELINSMKEYEQTRDELSDMTLGAYLQQVALMTNSDMDADTGHVRLMTIHQAKGLEFPNVFIVGLTEGLFPSHRTIRERRKDGEEEERRLMYVAVTRAENMLYMTESEGYLNDSGALKYPSRYLSEIPEGLIEVKGNPEKHLFEGTRSMADMLDKELYGAKEENVFPPGSHVLHKVFGEGIVEAYDSAAKSYRVKFDAGVRNLLPHVLQRKS